MFYSFRSSLARLKYFIFLLIFVLYSLPGLLGRQNLQDGWFSLLVHFPYVCFSDRNYPQYHNYFTHLEVFPTYVNKYFFLLESECLQVSSSLHDFFLVFWPISSILAFPSPPVPVQILLLLYRACQLKLVSPSTLYSIFFPILLQRPSNYYFSIYCTIPRGTPCPLNHVFTHTILAPICYISLLCDWSFNLNHHIIYTCYFVGSYLFLLWYSWSLWHLVLCILWLSFYSLRDFQIRVS